MNTSSKSLVRTVILRPAVGRSTSRDGLDFVALSRLFGPKFLAKKQSARMGIPSIPGGSSANAGPQNDSY